MPTDTEYENSSETSFLVNLRRNLSVITINQYVMVILAGLAIIIMSGIVFVLAQAPPFYISDIYGTRIIYYIPLSSSNTLNQGALNTQFGFETFVVAGILALGVYGIYLIKNSTSYIDDQRMALEVLAIGTVIFIIAAMLLFFVYMYKMTGRFPYFTGLA